MSDLVWLPKNIELAPHSTARNKAIAKLDIKAGDSILSTPSFASILLESQKGRRCDNCFRLPPEGCPPLKRCAGCGSYWYCDAQCQTVQWKNHHKKICKTFNSHISSLSYQALVEHEKQDSILLSHAVARLSMLPTPYSIEQSTLATVFLSLLPCQDESMDTLSICPIKPPPSDQLVRRMHSRFGNNNFAIHSHLTSIGHGIFPVASRLFNHSCNPNAAAKYTLSPTRSIVMEIVALRNIVSGDEICLPYLDPALLQTREQILEISYGFKCNCSSCSFLGHIGPLGEIPTDSNELSTLENQLRSFVAFNPMSDTSLPAITMEELPPALHCFLRESYMTSLSEKFSNASHDGQFDVALESGATLLALYIVIYPTNYPQIGMHLLEMAKTAWNARMTCSEVNDTNYQALKMQVEVFLTLASQVLTVFGEEGDKIGPLQEIALLQNLLKDERAPYS
uniref:SET domain-containing protein n=1 Tax=Psilocybe cubensis TaxID=181762 RepID=A0A8H7XZH3_PSICU